jgi:hypothetical protein
MPAAKKTGPAEGEVLVDVKECLEPWAQKAFEGTGYVYVICIHTIQ